MSNGVQPSNGVCGCFWNSCIGKAVSAFFEAITNIFKTIFGGCNASQEESAPLTDKTITKKNTSDLPKKLNPNTKGAEDSDSESSSEYSTASSSSASSSSSSGSSSSASSSSSRSSSEVSDAPAYPKYEFALEGKLPGAVAIAGKTEKKAAELSGQRLLLSCSNQDSPISTVRFGEENDKLYLEVRFRKNASDDDLDFYGAKPGDVKHKVVGTPAVRELWKDIVENNTIPQMAVDYVDGQLPA